MPHRKLINEAPSLLAAIVESSDDVIISKTLKGIITSWNSAAERLFEYSKEEAIGKHITLIIPPDRHKEETAIIDKISRGEKLDHFETIRVSKSGKLIPISITVSPVLNDKGEIIGASKVARDITERKRTQDLLASEARRKDEFIAMLAHELRNPLAPMKSAVDILNLGDGRSPNDAWAIDIIGRQITHMTRLVDDLLDIARITGDKLELKKEHISLETAINLAIETSRPLIIDRGHELHVQCPEPPVYVEADLVRLAQIISNLLNNAAKYTENGGRIWITACREGTDAVIKVRDTGIGIPSEEVDHVFTLFTQASNRSNGKGGLGIGLTLVKRLTEMHGGTAAVESAGTGFGSTFTIRIPALGEDIVPGTSTPSDLSLARGSKKVLIVDDNHDAVDSLNLLMRSYGADTRVAYDGLAALQTAAEFKPDVVLLDLGMPRLNGYEAARRIRALPDGENALLIATTGWGQETDRKRSMEAGFDHHLIKPIDITEIMNLVNAETEENASSSH